MYYNQHKCSSLVSYPEKDVEQYQQTSCDGFTAASHFLMISANRTQTL